VDVSEGVDEDNHSDNISTEMGISTDNVSGTIVPRNQLIQSADNADMVITKDGKLSPRYASINYSDKINFWRDKKTRSLKKREGDDSDASDKEHHRKDKKSIRRMSRTASPQKIHPRPLKEVDEIKIKDGDLDAKRKISVTPIPIPIRSSNSGIVGRDQTIVDTMQASPADPKSLLDQKSDVEKEKPPKEGKINLIKKKLEALPIDKILATPNLRIIKANINRITVISSSDMERLGTITTLTNLVLKSNYIKELPKEICLLSNLTLLNLSDNVLTSLPDEMLQLTNLKQLKLKKNRLTKLINLHKLPALEVVNVEKNCLDLSKLQRGIRGLVAPYHKQLVPQLVMENLYLGHYLTAQNHEELKKLKISHICIVGTGLKAFYPKEIRYKYIDIEDDAGEFIINFFPEAIRFIDDGRKHGNVLVHCKSGISRSASIILAYIICRLGKSYKAAYRQVNNARPCINPNEGFVKQLRQWQKWAKVLSKNIKKSKSTLVIDPLFALEEKVHKLMRGTTKKEISSKLEQELTDLKKAKKEVDVENQQLKLLLLQMQFHMYGLQVPPSLLVNNSGGVITHANTQIPSVNVNLVQQIVASLGKKPTD